MEIKKYMTTRPTLMWEVSTGDKVLVKDMTTTHVTNALKYLRRRSRFRSSWKVIFNMELRYRDGEFTSTKYNTKKCIRLIQ